MPQSTVQKLGIKPATTTLVFGHPVHESAELIGPLPDGALLVADGDAPFPTVLLFADSVLDVRAGAASAYLATAADGRFWIAYRKGAGRRVAEGEPVPLHRDSLQAALAELGLDGVTLIALDETWSAMRVKAV